MNTTLRTMTILLAGASILSAATHMAIYSPTQTVAHKLVTIDSVTFSVSADSMIVNKKDARLAYAVASIDSIRYRTAPERMTFIPAKGNSFLMGAKPPLGATDEMPQHKISLSYDFYMDTTEVTQKQYNAVMKPAYPRYSEQPWYIEEGKGDNYPAYDIYWDEAVLYCNQLSKLEGRDTVYSYTGVKDTINSTRHDLVELLNVTVDLSKNGYRLPTEAEWEYAARGGTSTTYYWSPYDTATFYAVYAENSQIVDKASPAYGMQTVASKRPNLYGLYDVSGNVQEWCNDFYLSTYYQKSPTIDPTGPSDSGYGHVIRGMNWITSVKHLRLSYRSGQQVGGYNGIRVVLPIQK